MRLGFDGQMHNPAGTVPHKVGSRRVLKLKSHKEMLRALSEIIGDLSEGAARLKAELDGALLRCEEAEVAFSSRETAADETDKGTNVHTLRL